MSSNKLISLVHEGRAAFKTYSTGGGAVWRIPVPKDNYIVLTKIIYHPFVDATRDDANYKYFMHHQLRLITTQKQHYFSYRESFQVTDNSLDPGNPIFNPGAAEQRSVYIPFEETVKINVVNLVPSEPLFWVGTFGGLPANVDEPIPPIGYGTVTATMLETNATGLNVAPLSQNILPSNGVLTVGVDQFIGGNNPLQNPVGLAIYNGMSFPLIDFEYFQIFEPIPQCMKGK